MYTHEVAHERIEALAELALQLSDIVTTEHIESVVEWQKRTDHLKGLVFAYRDEVQDYLKFCSTNTPCIKLMLTLGSIDHVLSLIRMKLEIIGRQFNRVGSVESWADDSSEHYVN